MIKIKNINIAVVLFFSFFAFGCSSEYRGGIISSKVPNLTTSISTTQSFEKDGDDLRKYPHDLSMAIDASRRSTAAVNNYFRNVTFNGNRMVNVKENTDYLHKTKIIGNNDYYVENNKIFKIEKQSDKKNCWAACLQYMIFAKFGKTVEQQRLIEEIKGDPNANNAASIDEMSKLMGYRGMQISQDGEEHVLVAIGANQPVMIGTIDEGNPYGHARLVVGARYSFLVQKAAIVTVVTDKKVFREFRVLDPWDQSDKYIPADQLVNNIKFLYSFDMNKY